MRRSGLAALQYSTGRSERGCVSNCPAGRAANHAIKCKYMILNDFLPIKK